MGTDIPRVNYPEVDSGYDPIPYQDIQASGHWPRDFQIPADWIPVLSTLTARGPSTPKLLVATAEGHLIVHPDENPNVTVVNDSLTPIYVCGICATPTQPVSAPSPLPTTPSPPGYTPVVSDWTPLTSSGLNYIYDMTGTAGKVYGITVDVRATPSTSPASGSGTVTLQAVCIVGGAQKSLTSGTLTWTSNVGQLTLTYASPNAPADLGQILGGCAAIKLGLITPVNNLEYRINGNVQ